MAATQPPQGNLKDRIAALQQRNGTPSPTSSPTPSRDLSVTPPRGGLRDKIAKFERKGGVPIPRGSFAMGAPPPEDAGSTKSRELYGNRVAALGKGRPTAPGNSGYRAVTSPPGASTTTSSQPSSDENSAKSTAHLVPPPTTHSVSLSMPPSRRSSSEFTDRQTSDLDVVDKPDEAQGPADDHHETSIQRRPDCQRESLPEVLDTEPSESFASTLKSSAESGVHTDGHPATASLVSPTSLAGSIVTTPSSDEASEHISLPKAALSKTTSIQAGNVSPSVVHTALFSQSTPTPAESHAQERVPVVGPQPAVSIVQTHITIEQAPVKEATINTSSRGSRLDQSLQNDSLTPSSTHSDESSVTQLASPTSVNTVDNLKASSTSNPSNVHPVDKVKVDLLQDRSSTSESSIAFPSSTPANSSGNPDDPIIMSLSPTTKPGRRSFSAIVHRNDGDKRPDSRHSTTSRSSTVTSHPSSSSFKPGTDGGVVRSKRNFKHLGTVTTDPPPSPGAGDLGVGDLAALLQEAAWLEQRLSDENTTFEMPSAPGEEGPKAEMESAPSPATTTKADQVTPSPPVVATSTRSKGRGLILSPLTSAPSTKIPHSPIRSSTSTPSFQVHPVASVSPEEVSPTPPKSTRGRKYFSLRGALRGPRLSVSSEMSSDDSAPVATPPSPTFDLSMPQASHGHSNDSMSVRSMFSSRSNKSGKSDSAPGSLRLSPRRGVARASSFAERLLNRASKTKSLLDDPDDAILEQTPMLPPIIPETPGSLLSISPISPSPKSEVPFDRDIFDAFPNVPSDIPQRPASYLFPVSPKTAVPVQQDFRRSSTIGVPPSEKGSHEKSGWLRTRQES